DFGLDRPGECRHQDRPPRRPWWLAPSTHCPLQHWPAPRPPPRGDSPTPSVGAPSSRASPAPPDEVIARLHRGWPGLRGPSPPHAAPAAGVGYDAIADRMIPPGLGTAASPARPPVLILRDRRFGIRRTGKPASLHALHVLCNSSSFLLLGGGIGLGLLLRQLARMHHHKAERFERYSSVAVLNLHLPAHTLSMPAARRFILGPPRLLQQEGQGGLLLPPGFEGLADGTRARD